MKVLAIREAKAGLSAALDEAQHERVLITRNGKPSAIVIGVEGHEYEDVLLMSNPRFWEMIEASRQDPTMFTMSEIRKRYAEKATTEQAVSVKRDTTKSRRSARAKAT